MASSSLHFPPISTSTAPSPLPGGLSYAANVSASAAKPAPFPLADGFFLLNFSTEEDLESVLSGGPWFPLGKPFILQRWSPKFKPKRDEDALIPVWIKIVDFPLALWTPTGISKISSYVGIPISVDALTANRSRLTFARICVLISKDSPLPDEIPIEIEGEDITLTVLYDWKPEKCEGCGSLIHPFSLCPKNPNPKPILPPKPPKSRGRSTSRPPHSRPSSSQPTVLAPPSKSNTPLQISNPSAALLPTPNPEVQPLDNLALQNLNSAPNNPLLASEALQLNPPTSPAKIALLPNLNSPTEEASSSGLPSSPVLIQPQKIPLLNKFSSLQTEELIPPDSSESFSENDKTSTTIAEEDSSPSSKNQNLSESVGHNTRSSVDRGKSPKKSKPPKAKSAKKAKGQKS
ncbi:putative proline-rich receptor-like protein kinase PERK11 [Dendrobium catenatum]|uniref:putative proline-rich receptor-like protein kinase PERK11 n=1 Tax=Dendrobium catenatum TaxID=906689 RepID=UPI0009F3C092|nr:putative proline-rich receptor-like protein kinase PERK11 [Dendrobium catenatum]